MLGLSLQVWLALLLDLKLGGYDSHWDLSVELFSWSREKGAENG